MSSPETVQLAALNRTYRWAAFGQREPKWLRDLKRPLVVKIVDDVMRGVYQPKVAEHFRRRPLLMRIVPHIGEIE